MPIDQYEVVYCEGWDPASRAVAGPMPPADAADRDRAGEQYAVLLVADAAPQALIEVSWRDHSCVLWGFDAEFRRVVKQDFRRVEDGLLLVENIEWQYATPGQAEFDPAVPTLVSQTRTDLPEGGMTVTDAEGVQDLHAPLGMLTVPVPRFGDWRPLLLQGDVALESGEGQRLVDDDPIAVLMMLSNDPQLWRLRPVLSEDAPLTERFPLPPGLPAVPATGPLWRPPQPLRPDPEVLALAEPARPKVVYGQQVVIESYQAGHVRMPTGAVVACAPDDYLLTERAPFTVTVPPGTYEFVVNVARRTEEVGMAARVAAAGVRISPEPAVSWEFALLPGQDPRLLRDGESYCFAVDGGTACFMDAVAITAVADRFSRGDDPLEYRELAEVLVAEMDDLPSGANLIAFSSGWGDGCYPVWIGRTAGGAVCCFVADMQLFA